MTEPGRDGRRALRATTFGAVALLAGVVYAWLASGTTPFTTPANVTTAVPLAGMIAVIGLQRARPAVAIWQRLPADRPPDRGSAWPWLVLVVLLAVPEVASLFAGARASHPTLSSLTDSLFHWRVAKAAVYFVWLCLCWYLVRR